MNFDIYIVILQTLLSKVTYNWGEMLLQFKVNVFHFGLFYSVIYSCDAKLNSQQQLLQTSVSH